MLLVDPFRGQLNAIRPVKFGIQQDNQLVEEHLGINWQLVAEVIDRITVRLEIYIQMIPIGCTTPSDLHMLHHARY